MQFDLKWYLNWWVLVRVEEKGRWKVRDKDWPGEGAGQRRLGTLSVEVPLVFLHPAGCGTYTIKKLQG